MTTRIEEILNLESLKDMVAAEVEAERAADIEDEAQSTAVALKAEKNSGLPVIPELDEIDETELDELADKAEQAYDNLMDLGMNVEAKYSSKIFEVASSMLKHAIDAKNAKADRKQRSIEMRLRKYRIDNTLAPKSKNKDEPPELTGNGFVVDRNELIEQLKNKGK